MKKYIAPVAKSINLMSEGSILAESNISLTNEVGRQSYELSNERDRSVSGSIWGNEELY